MYKINDIIVKFDYNQYNFFVIVNITNYYIILHKLKKDIKLININDKLFNEVNIMYNIQDNNDKWITLENDKKFRFYIKNINNLNIEKYKDNHSYIEDNF